MTESGGDIVTITCTASLDSIPDALEDKLGLSVLFDVGGCMEYTTAVVEVSDNIGQSLFLADTGFVVKISTNQNLRDVFCYAWD